MVGEGADTVLFSVLHVLYKYRQAVRHIILFNKSFMKQFFV